MSSASPSIADRHDLPSAGATGLFGILLIPVRFVSFWTAVALPFVLFPLLLTGAAGEHLLTFAGLAAANVLAFVLGHGYGAD